MRLTIAPGEANRLEKLGLTDVDTYQSKVGEVGNASLHAALKDLNHCGLISTLEGFESVGNRCEVLQFPSDQYAVLRGVNPGPEPITGSTSNGDADQCNEKAPSERMGHPSALAQVTQHDLIFNRWGLGERHPIGLALAFNFAGPPGTGKTICAEAIAHSLGRRLLLVRYAELESLWMGETPKNVAAIFRMARDDRAVLLFDEADAIAVRRSTSVDHGFHRESNTVISVLLQAPADLIVEILGYW